MLAGLAVDVRALAGQLGAGRVDRLAARARARRSPGPGPASRSPDPGTRGAARRRSRRRASAWPRPIGDETNSARRDRLVLRCHGGRRGGTPATRSTNSRSSRLICTGSRAVGAWPPPSIVTSSPPVSRATASPRANGMMRSSSPWTTSTGQRTDRQSASTARDRRARARALGGDHGLRRRVQAPGDAVLDLLGRVRLREDLRPEELEEAALVRAASSGGCTSPSPRGVGTRRRTTRVARSGGAASASAPPAPIRNAPSTRSGWAAASSSARSPPARGRRRPRCRARGVDHGDARRPRTRPS